METKKERRLIQFAAKRFAAKRRAFARLLVAAPALLLAAACALDYDAIGGDFAGPPREMLANISGDAKQLLERSFRAYNSPTTAVADYHIHIVARGTQPESRDAYVHPDLNTWRRPFLRVKTRAFMSASGVTDWERLDQQYAARLLDLLVHFQSVRCHYAPKSNARFHIYAMDYYCLLYTSDAADE